MHLKGTRFGFPLIRRVGLLKHNETYQVFWNRHPGIEIHYVLKGAISWELHGRASPLTISGGSFGIVPARSRHRALDNKGTPAIRLGIIFEKPSPEHASGTPFSPDDIRRIFRRFRQNGCCVRRFSTRLSALLREFSDAITLEAVQNPDNQLQLRSLASSLVYETYITLGRPEALAEGHEVVPKIRKWIDSHCAEQISTDRLVKLSGYGRSRFFSLFLADTGMTPNNYLVRARINLAKRILTKKKGKVSILDAAIACGFKSASVFSTTFRKQVGLSPRKFRSRGS